MSNAPSGAAQRRRERRLRAWQRHLRTAVQLALAEKLHHSACRTHLPGKEWMEQDAALRGQTARARGLEMESFPHCPLRGLRPPSPSGVLPSLATPQLAANETLGSAALSFLLNRALEEKEKEEEERVKREEEQVKRQEDQEEALLTRLQAERDALLVLGLEALSSQQKRRLNTVLDEREAILDRRERRRVVAKAKEEKRRKKKRKKKKLPEVSSHSSCGRARRRQRQYVGHFFPCVSLRHGGRCPCCAGRAGTEVQFLNKCFVPVWLIPQAQFLDWVVVFTTSSSSLSWRRGFSLMDLLFLQTIGRPQLQAIDKVVHVHIVQVVQSTGAVRVGSLHRLCCMEWHIGVDIRRFPVVQLVLVSRVTLQPVEIPQAQFWDKVFMPVDSGRCVFTALVTEPFVMSFTVGGVREAHASPEPACCRRPPNRPEGIRGLASFFWPSSSFVVLFWEEEEEEEEEQEEALQVLFWCADTALCAQVPLSLFFLALCSLSTAPCIWQSLVRCSPWFDSGYMLCQFTAAFVAQLYYVTIITPVIHYCMGGLVCGELCSFGPRFSGHLRSVRGGAVLGQGYVPARCWATTGPHGPDSAETRAVLDHGC